MASILRFVQGLQKSQNTMTDTDHNSPISSQEMQTRAGKTDFAEEVKEDHFEEAEDRQDVTENLIDFVGDQESSVDRVDYVSGNQFQSEGSQENVNGRQPPQTQPQENKAVTSGQGVVQNVDQIVRDFEKAVSTGDLEKSSAILKLMVKHKAKLRVQVLSIGSNEEQPFIINVNVETYKVATGPKWTMQVTPSLTIFALKLKTSLLYGLPLSNQRWIMGNSIPGDTAILRDCNVRDNSEVFLYLIAPQGGDSKEEIALVDGFHKQLMLQGINNVELSFTPAEYNKYLKEAKLRQNSSRTEQTDRVDHQKRPINMQPPPGQVPLPSNTNQYNQAQPLVELTRPMEVFPGPFDTRFFMGADIDDDQLLPNATAETPQSTPRAGFNFPPPHLVQRGPPISEIKKERHVLTDRQPRREMNQNVFAIPAQKTNIKKTSRPHENRAKSRRVLRKKPITDQLERCQSVGKLDEVPRRNGRDMLQGSHFFDPDRVQSLDFYRKPEGFAPRPKRDGRKNDLPFGKSDMIRPTDLDKFTPLRKYDPYNDGGHENDIPKFHAFPGFKPLFPPKAADGQQVNRPEARTSRRLQYRGSPVFANRFDDDLYFEQPRRNSLPSALDVGWKCPACTFVNPPQIPGCRMCFQDRPEKYHLPDYGSYVMDKDEAKYVAELEKNEKKLVEMQMNEEKKKKTLAYHNRIELYQAAEINLTTNEEPFECPVCFSEIEPNEGVRLQECLHEICRECLSNHINISNEAEVHCPFTDGENDCQEAITDREIRQIVGQAKYDEYKMRSLKSAEAKAANTFHCLTPNCEGFCFYDEEHNFFECPICKHMSCLTCKVIHEGQNCREYQDDIKAKAINDETARQTQEQLQRLIQDGLAMNCPQCGVVIQKKGGCPNMTCSVCHRGFRWTGRQDL